MADRGLRAEQLHPETVDQQDRPDAEHDGRECYASVSTTGHGDPLMSRYASRRARGQSLVEFALVLPIFLLIVFGIIDGGRVVFANNEMAQITRNVARVASTTCFATTPACDKTPGPIAAAIATKRRDAQ